MQQGIHPTYSTITVTCSCGEVFKTRSTFVAEKEDLLLDVCSKCHPFYTGKQKLVDTSGRIDKFRQRYANKEASNAKAVAAANEVPATATKSKAKSKAKSAAKSKD